MKLLFLGAGATGGYFGGRLAAADSDVTFLVRPARAARMRDRPLRIESPLKAITGDGLAGASYDLVVLSCKAYDLDDAIAAVRPAVGEGTRVLPVLNGLAHLDRLDAAFGTERVLGGLCQIASTLAEDGTVRHLNRTHLLVFGARTAEQRSFCEALLGEISGRGFDVQLSDDIGLEMWEKWVLLATLAAVTCLMRAPIGDIVAAPGGEPLIGVRRHCHRRRLRAAPADDGADPRRADRARLQLRCFDAARHRGREADRGRPHHRRSHRPGGRPRRRDPAARGHLLPPEGLREPADPPSGLSGLAYEPRG